MKRLFVILMIMSVCSCEKLGKDGRVRQEVDYSQWYYDDMVEDDGKPRVKIMSFNVRNKNGDDTNEKHWNNRRKGCYAMINTLRPVVMGVQECKGSQKDELEANCKGYEVAGKGRQGNWGDEHCAIFYLKDSVSVHGYGNFWLTQTPDKVSKHPEAAHYRMATWLKFKHTKTGNYFYVLNTHLDLAVVRDFEMAVIMNYIENNFGDTPVVLTGDWNTTETDPIFEYMYQTFQDARAVAQSGDSYGTFNGFSNPNNTKRIDHIFCRGFSACTEFVTVKQSWEGFQFISDHYPVYAVLKF